MQGSPPENSTTPRLHLRGRNRTKADVFVYDRPGGAIAVKSYAPRGFVVRNTLGRWLTSRECKAYAAAAGTAGLPAFHGKHGPSSLATAWIDATSLADSADGTVAPVVFDRLRRLVESLHARGIALVDLKHRDVLIDTNDDVHIVDLATAWVRKRDGRVANAIFERLRQADLFTIERLRSRFAVGRPPIDFDATPLAVAWHRRARRIKWRWDRLRGAPRIAPIDDHWR